MPQTLAFWTVDPLWRDMNAMVLMKISACDFPSDLYMD